MATLSADQLIPFEPDLVFATVRDNLPGIVAHLPNVARVEETSRSIDADRHTITNSWFAEAAVPAIARAFINPDKLGWDDHAVWHADTRTCDWVHRTHFLADRIHSAGTNTYRGAPDGGTVLEIRGTLGIDLGGMPGVPRVIGRRAAPQVERFVARLLLPNLQSLATAVTAYLEEAS